MATQLMVLQQYTLPFATWYSWFNQQTDSPACSRMLLPLPNDAPSIMLPELRWSDHSLKRSPPVCLVNTSILFSLFRWRWANIHLVWNEKLVWFQIRSFLWFATWITIVPSQLQEFTRLSSAHSDLHCHVLTAIIRWLFDHFLQSLTNSS